MECRGCLVMILVVLMRVRFLPNLGRETLLSSSAGLSPIVGSVLHISKYEGKLSDEVAGQLN